MKPEAFAQQIHLNQKKFLKLFLLKFSNFNVNVYNFSNLKKIDDFTFNFKSTFLYYFCLFLILNKRRYSVLGNQKLLGVAS